MLVLTRRPGQKIFIGEDITVEIIDVRGKTVKVGVTAPRDIEIKRDDMNEGKTDE